jgi:hypothetical protein
MRRSGSYRSASWRSPRRSRTASACAAPATTTSGAAGLFEDDTRRGATLGAGRSRAERDDEIRQMLTARNARRESRGQAPLDVEDELHRLTREAPKTADPALEAEVRQLVVARNERRVRAGKPPLEVDAEVQRQLRELTG